MKPDLQQFEPDYVALAHAVGVLVEQSYGAMLKAGWHTNLENGEPLAINRDAVARKIALIHSELSEALEADRKSLMDDKLPHRGGVEVEVADALLRVTDSIGALEITEETQTAMRSILTLPRPAVAFAMVLRTIGELAAEHGIDLAGAVSEKAAFNAVRQDHKVETRLLANGKAF